MLSRIASTMFTICLALLLGTPNIDAGLSQQEKVIAGSPGDSMEVRHLLLKGTNEEIGRALAQLAGERYQAKPEPSRDALRTRVQRRYIERNYPILYDRMRGVASWNGRRVDDDAWDYSSLAFIELHAACSVVHVPAQRTSMGTSVVSRDYDYSTGSINFGFLAPGMLHPTARPYLVELHPDKGYASVAMVAYDLLSGVLDGMNSEGLTVTMAMDDELFTHYKIEPTLGPSPGLGVLQMLRLLLDTCATVDEAKEALLQTKQYYEYIPVHYLIADRFGHSFIWEYSQAHNKEFIIENPGQPLVMTNFSLNQHLDHDRPPSAEQAKNVCKRYSLLTEQLGDAGLVSEALIRQTHKRADAQLPASADTSRPPVRTFWHALYYPEQRRVKFSFYLHDEPQETQSSRIGVVRSDYIEFRLEPTNRGTERTESHAGIQQDRTLASTSTAQQPPAVAKLKEGGATVKLDRDRAVSVNLDKATDLAALLPLLRELPDLTDLTIRNPKMDDAGLAMLANLPKLVGINLLGAAVSDEGFKAFKKMPLLRVLEAGGTKVTDAGFANLQGLVHLEQLGLKATGITDEGLAHFEKLTNLIVLNLSETKVTDAGLAHLSALTRLESLSLANDAITDAGLAHLSSLKNITGLFLTGTNVTDAGLIHLKPMGRLTKLYLRKTAVTDAGAAEARKFLPSWATIVRD